MYNPIISLNYPLLKVDFLKVLLADVGVAHFYQLIALQSENQSENQIPNLNECTISAFRFNKKATLNLSRILV